MEQYIQMLIPHDSDFAPQPARVAALFEMLEKSWHFELDRTNNHTPALQVFKLLSKAEIEKAMEGAGAAKTLPRLDRVKLEKADEIPETIRRLPRCSVSANGHWRSNSSPIKIPNSFWPGGQKRLWGSVACDLRPEPVCMSNWWTTEDHTGLLRFGDPADPGQTVGLFTHPISKRNIEIPFAGSARFWVSFDFGEWLVPHVAEDFDLLPPNLVRLAEEHLGIEMSQAGRALP
jgi:hypothetical protein